MKKGRQFVMDLSNNFFRNPYLNNFVKVLIIVALYVVILSNANILVYGLLFDIVIFAMWHAVFENVLVKLMYKHATKYIVLTFGSIMIIPVIIAATMAYMMNLNTIMIRTTEMFLGFVVLFMVSRKIISILLQGFIKRKRYEKTLLERMNEDV